MSILPRLITVSVTVVPKGVLISMILLVMENESTARSGPDPEDNPVVTLPYKIASVRTIKGFYLLV